MNAQQKRYLNLIKTEPYKFGQWVGFSDLTELHNDWLKSFLFARTDQTLLAHRGSYKTTTLALAIAILLIIAPTKNIIFFRKTDTDVVEIVNQVGKIMQSAYFIKLAFVLYGIELTMTKNTSSEIDTNLHTDSRGTSQLVGMGINTSITGKHADIVITDDIVNVQDRVSRAERERTKLQYQELQNIKNRGGRFINTGTPWHKEDAISLMPNVVKYDCYSTGMISRDQLQNLRDSMTTSLFAANYELRHIASEDAMFEAPQFTAEIKAILNGVCHIDAAYGGSDGTAFTIIKEGKDGGLVAFGKRWKKHVDDCLDEILLLQQHYQAGSFYCEDNGDKGYLAKTLQAHGAYVSTYHESQNKYIKIATYLRKYWTQIEWLDDTDPDYLNEILDYTENAEHDDCPDSAASLIRQIKTTNKWLY